MIVAITVMTLVLGFFYTRERQLWEDKMAIAGLEERGKTRDHPGGGGAGEDAHPINAHAARPLGVGQEDRGPWVEEE